MNQIETSIDFAEYLELLGKQEADQIVGLRNGLDKAMERIRNGPENYGATLPWEKTHDLIRFRPSEVTVWAGVNKHGKTEVLSNALIPWALEGKVQVTSLEMPIGTLCQRFLQQATAMSQPSEEKCMQAVDMVDGRYFVYDEVASVNSETILGVVAYAAHKLECDHIVVDSLVKCKLSLKQNDMVNAQRDFVDKLCWIAKHSNSHIHLVHHMRKGESELKPGNKMDVKGAGEITDMVDNIMLVWRNKPKEQELWLAETNGQPAAMCEHYLEPDTMLTIAGQREGGREGQIGLWFDRSSRRYLADRRDIPMPYIGGDVEMGDW